MIKIKDRLNEKSLECSKIKEIHNEEMEQLLMQKEDIMHSTIKMKEQMVRIILLIIQHSIFSIHVIYKIKFLFFRAEI